MNHYVIAKVDVTLSLLCNYRLPDGEINNVEVSMKF
jgi:hypothetical protein